MYELGYWVIISLRVVDNNLSLPVSDDIHSLVSGRYARVEVIPEIKQFARYSDATTN